VAVFDRSVRLADGTRSLVTAAKGSFRGPDEVAVFTGTPEAPAEYRGETTTIRGAVLTWLRKEDRVDASGNVRTVFRGGVSGVGTAPEGEPYYSQSDTLRMTMSERVATLEGSVRAWQKENVLRSAKLVLNDAEKTIRAEGNVRAVFRRRPSGTAAAVAGKPKAGAETVSAAGDVLTHREAERKIRIEGNASMVSGSWTMNATVADIRLTKERAVESAEARGSVNLEDRATARRGEGSVATWRPETETVVLEGTPATALDGKGNRMTGARLTFRQGRSRVDVESAPGVKSEGTYKPEGS
jgi:lipopolysaccharide export system protein LptA